MSSQKLRILMIFICGKSVDIEHLWLMRSHNNIFVWIGILLLEQQVSVIIIRGFCIICYWIYIYSNDYSNVPIIA
jgi:Kef-type K+ transport system membrane component KefB